MWLLSSLNVGCVTWELYFKVYLPLMNFHFYLHYHLGLVAVVLDSATLTPNCSKQISLQQPRSLALLAILGSLPWSVQRSRLARKSLISNQLLSHLRCPSVPLLSFLFPPLSKEKLVISCLGGNVRGSWFLQLRVWLGPRGDTAAN